MKQDEIATNLGQNLKNFLDYFQNELQNKVLELDTNVKSKGYQLELIRISNSLEQYLKKEVGLFYVGFLGSYSSGKTSTINSLLELWGTETVRKVSNNPTDDCITLIANQSNVQSVFSFAKEGSISIRTNTNFDSRFLDNVVIMDTPGSGDPNIIESIVRDSLPLCDLIIYTLNATAPFTEIDKPFLIAQQTKLKNIPILFVLTRADEFKESKTSELSKDNFNQNIFDEELHTLINRINETLKVSTFTEKDFVAIDNKHGFNIDILKSKISMFTDNSNEGLIILHNHKLSYFKNEIKIIHNYYLDLTNTKIDKCTRFIDKAQDNIEYFNRQIDISKMKFRALWNENIQSFSRIYDGTIKSYADGLLEDIKFVTIISDTSNFILFKNDINEKIQKASIKMAQDLIAEIETNAYNEITKLKNNIFELVNYDNLTIENEQLNNNIDFSLPLEFPLNKTEYARNFIDMYKQKVQEDFKTLKNTFDKIQKSLQLKKPLDTVNEHILKYKEASIEILNLYYDAIKMYNVVAFSFEVKNYISELGLAKDFDKLESNDPNKAKYDLIAEKALLDNYEELSKEYENKIDLTFTDSDNIKKNLLALNIPTDNINFSEVISKANEDVFDSNEISSTLLTDTYRELINNLQNNFFDLKKDIDKLKRERYLRYFVFASVPLIISIIVWFILKYKNVLAPTSFIGVVSIGIATSLVSTLISSIFDKYKNKKYTRIDIFKDDLRKNSDQIIEKSFALFKQKNIDKKSELTKQLQLKWSNEEINLFKNLSQLSFSGIDNEIIEIKRNLQQLIETYKSCFTSFHEKTLNLFNSQEKFSIKIDEVASQIKEDSIKPSFQLLKNTLEEIKTVRSDIEQLEY